MDELTTERFPFEYRCSFPLINAVVSKSQGGKVFQYLPNDDILYVFHKSGFSYLTKSANLNYKEIVNFFIHSKDLPGYFHIYDPAPEIISSCQAQTDLINFKIRERVQLKIHDKKFRKAPNLLPPNYAIVRIDNDNFSKFNIFNVDLENKFWSCKSDFLKNGFGFGIFNEEDLPVSLCYTACISDNIAEIDIITLPSYQQRGLAGIIVSQFVNYCNTENLVANWDCFVDNIGSLKTAEKVGFVKDLSYKFLSIYNKGINS